MEKMRFGAIEWTELHNEDRVVCTCVAQRPSDGQYFYARRTTTSTPTGTPAYDQIEYEILEQLNSYGIAGCFCGIVRFKSNRYGSRIEQRKGCSYHREVNR